MHFLLADLILFELGLRVDLLVGLQVLSKVHSSVLLFLFDTPWSHWDSLLATLLCEALDHIRKLGGNVRASWTHRPEIPHVFLYQFVETLFFIQLLLGIAGVNGSLVVEVLLPNFVLIDPQELLVLIVVLEFSLEFLGQFASM